MKESLSDSILSQLFILLVTGRWTQLPCSETIYIFTIFRCIAAMLTMKITKLEAKNQEMIN